MLDACTDATEEAAAQAAAAHPWLRLRPLQGTGRGRRPRAQARHGPRRAARCSRPAGAAASSRRPTRTASSPPTGCAPSSTSSRAGRTRSAARSSSPSDLEDDLVRRRARRGAQRRMAAVRARDPGAEHHHFSGASMGVTADAYTARRAASSRSPRWRTRRSSGGCSPRGFAVERPAAVRVSTAPRLQGRAPRGLAADLALDRWLQRRTYHAADFTLERLVACKRESVVRDPPREGVRADDRSVLDARPDAARCRGRGRGPRRGRRVRRRDRRPGAGARRRRRAGGRAPARARPGARQGRRDVARARRDHRRHRRLHRRGLQRRRRVVRARRHRPADLPPRPRAREGRLPPPLSPGRRGADPERRRARDRADGPPAAQPPRAGAGGLRAAAGGRDRRPQVAAGAPELPGRLRRGDRDAHRRVARGRARRAGPGGPRRAAQPPPAAARARAHGATRCSSPRSDGSASTSSPGRT